MYKNFLITEYQVKKPFRRHRHTLDGNIKTAFTIHYSK